MATWTSKQIRGWADAVQSLKLYRRAELRDESTNKPLIERLYVDPLPDDAVLTSMLRPNTTFLIGRKGTGKSTVFQRAQHEIRKSRRFLSAYLDIKTIFESAEVDQGLTNRLDKTVEAFSEGELRRFLLYKAFVREVLGEIKKELVKQSESSVLERIREGVLGSKAEAFYELDVVLENAFKDDFEDVTAFQSVRSKEGRSSKDESSMAGNAKASAKARTLSFSAELEAEITEVENESRESSEERAFSRVLIRRLNIVEVMKQIIDILNLLDISRLYVFVDDISELPEGAMRALVDSLLAPLNNWSNETIKLKIAAYPGRVYYGQIDKTKIDEVYLDLFKLYGSSDVGTMEDKAVDFTRRLLDNRLEHFAKSALANFSEGSLDEVYRHIFFATMGNPRALGSILSNLQESRLAFGMPVVVRAVREASAKYYEEKVQPFFGMQKFRQETFNERSSVFSLKELLELLVDRARTLRSYRGSALFAGLEGRPPTSHFHVVRQLEGLLLTLELNFFMTKYFEMKDRDGRDVSIFALNYGLCNSYSIEFGRPASKREYRLYYVERIFDSSSILKSYLERNQEIRCRSCDGVLGLDKLEGLRLYGMLCPICKVGQCEVVNLSKKYEEVLANVDDCLLLPRTELGILETLYTEDRELVAAEIAGELDCSYQLVGKRAKIMEGRGLVERSMIGNRRRFKLTGRALDEYFKGNESRTIKIADDVSDGGAKKLNALSGRKDPNLFRETGRLNDKGVETVYAMFDAGKTRYAVAQELGISVGAATHRHTAWKARKHN